MCLLSAQASFTLNHPQSRNSFRLSRPSSSAAGTTTLLLSSQSEVRRRWTPQKHLSGFYLPVLCFTIRCCSSIKTPRQRVTVAEMLRNIKYAAVFGVMNAVCLETQSTKVHERMQQRLKCTLSPTRWASAELRVPHKESSMSCTPGRLRAHREVLLLYPKLYLSEN